MLFRGLRCFAPAAVVLACAVTAGQVRAQPRDAPNGLLLIAKPSLVDPNFARTVVLVTQTPDASTVGVVLNRPTKLALAQLLPPGVETRTYKDAIYWGGPVMPRVILALFHSENSPSTPAFHVHRGLYLSMDPRNVESLLAESGARYRLYAGFAGWLPRQLSRELARDDWYLLPVEEEILFRKDTSGLWAELLARVAGTRAVAPAPGMPENPAPKIESPAVAGLGSRTHRAVP